MVKKVVAALLLIAAISVFLTIREEGKDKAFGGALAPLESARGSNAAPASGHDPLAGMVTGTSIPQVSQSNYGQMVDRVRTRVNDAMDQSERRSSR